MNTSATVYAASTDMAVSAVIVTVVVSPSKLA
jgi:hypothetical protein